MSTTRNGTAGVVNKLHTKHPCFTIGCARQNKKTWLLFDSSFHPGVDHFSINNVMDMTDEWIILYGMAMPSHLAWIWNSLISHFGKPIFHYCDDVANAFRYIILHPDIARSACFHYPCSRLTDHRPGGSFFGTADSPADYDMRR